jgi:hypothetical protein
MPRKYRPTADEVADLTIYNISLHPRAESRGCAVISRGTLRRLSMRYRLEVEGFIDKWIDELAERGWTAFRFDDTRFGLVRSDIVQLTWPRVTSVPLKRELDGIRRGEQHLFDELREQFSDAAAFKQNE